MFIRKVEVTNIREIEKLTINFTEDFTQIKGENMTGKTSLFYAIQFALFGLSGTGVTGEDLYRTGTESSQVVVAFTYQGKKYLVVRTKTTATISSGGDRLANGKSATTDYITRLLGVTTSAEMLVTASSIVDLINPLVLEENVVGIAGFDRLSAVDSEVKDELKELNAYLVQTPTYDVLSKDELSVYKEQYDNSVKVKQAHDAKVADLITLVAHKARALEVKHALTMPAPMEVTGSQIAHAKNLRERWQVQQDVSAYLDSHPCAVPENYLEERERYEEDQKYNASLKERKKEWLEIPKGDWSAVHEQIKETLETLSEARTALRLWRDAKPSGSGTGLNSEELLALVNQYKLKETADGIIEQGVCDKCGTVLSEEAVEDAKNTLANLPAGLNSTAARTKHHYEAELELEKYPPEPNFVEEDYVEAKKRYDTTKQYADAQKALAGVEDEKYRENTFKINEIIEGFLPRNADSKWIRDHNEQLTLMGDLKEPVEKEVSEEEVRALIESRSAYLEHCRIRDKLLIEKTNLPSLESIKLAEEGLNKLRENPPELTFVDYPQMVKEDERHKAHNAEVQSARERYDELKAFQSALRKATAKVRTELWSKLLQGASAFCEAVTGGKIYELNRGDKGFTYTEGGVIRSVAAGSGLQRTVIGLALRLARKQLQNDPLPLLLDEVTGRLSHTYRANFISEMSSQGYQKILVSHSDSEDVMLDTIDFSSITMTNDD